MRIMLQGLSYVLCLAAAFLIVGCDTSIIREAKEAENEGRVINN
jgi:hypothetical protein